MPAWNSASHLDRAMTAALGQSLAEIEVVAVDDASTDATHQALLAWAARDRRVKVLRHESNRGPAAGRNTALAAATGRWVAPLDDDDSMRPDRLARLVARAEAEGADLLADNPTLFEFETGAERGPCWPEAAFAALAAAPLTTAGLLRGDDVEAPGHAKFGYLKPLIRRDFLARTGIAYRPEFRLGEDLLLYFECLAAGARFLLAPDSLYLYAVRPASASAGRHGALRLAAATRAMRRVPAGEEVAALLRTRQRTLDAMCFDLSVESRKLGDALRYAVTADPARVRRRLRAMVGRVAGRR